MIAYIDSSVLLRVVFSEPDALKEFRKIKGAVSSELLRVECMRTIDRVRVTNRFSDEIYLEYIRRFFLFLDRIDLIPIQREILNRASQPFPTTLGSLDAVHLASAILYREKFSPKLVLTSHDKQLLGAGMASGFQVFGG
jgi:predicted nucleic acid-binding protein